MKGHLEQILKPIWDILVQGYVLYEKTVIAEDLLGDAAQDSDGEVVSFESMTTLILTFIETLVDSKPYRGMLSTLLGDLLYVLVGYMQITADQEETWASDVNQFVIDEEDVSNNYTVRYASATVVQRIVGHFKNDGAKALTSAIVKHLEAAKVLSSSNKKTWWKFVEAAIFAVGTCADAISSHPNTFDAKAFASTVLLEHVTSSNSFLSGRAMWTASQISSSVPIEIISPFVKACAFQLTSNNTLAVKICACKAAAFFSPKIDKKILVPVLPQIIEGIVSLVPEATEDLLHLVLDSLSVLVKVDEEVSAKYESVLCPAVLAVWAKHINDRFITTIVQDIMMTMANNSLCLASVTERLWPVIHTILKPGVSQPSGVSEAGVSLLTTLTHAYEGKVPEAFFSILFPLLIELMQKTEDGSLMQEGATCLAAFVRSGKATIIQGVKTGLFDALTPILKVVARLLTDQNVSDDAARHVGLLVSALILNTTEVLSPMLSDLLKSVIIRLSKATQAGLIQSLIIVFAKLICSGHEKDVISFLKTFQMEDKTSGLCYLMKIWTKFHEEFSGAYYLKLSSVALAKIFHFSDNEINEITVEGDLLVNNNEGIITRSKKKQQQFRIIPLKVKIITLLAREHAVIDEENDQVEDEDDDEEEEGSYEVSSPFDKETLDVIGIDEKQGMYLSEFMDADLFDVDANEEPDAVNDPVYSLNLKNYIYEFFKALAATETSNLQALGAYISASDLEVIKDILNTKK